MCRNCEIKEKWDGNFYSKLAKIETKQNNKGKIDLDNAHCCIF